MYAAIIRKKAKVAGTKSRPFLNYLAYTLAGCAGLGFAGWMYFKQETPSNAGLRSIKTHWLTRKVVDDIASSGFIYISPALSAEARKERETKEKVYESYLEKHGNPEGKQE